MTAAPFSAFYGEMYDTIYRDKRYRREAARVGRLIRSSRPSAARVLELGTGTGGHAVFLSRHFRVVGIARASAMIRVARRKLAGRPVRLIQADISRLPSYGRRFDACVALFHVMNYLTAADLLTVLRRVKRSLVRGGVVVLDSWNGAAVLEHGLRTRRRSFTNGSNVLVRESESELDWASSQCSVRISLKEYRGGNLTRHTRELHRMRYYFPAELRLLIEQAGLKVLSVTSDSGKSLTRNDWSMQVIALRQ